MFSIPAFPIRLTLATSQPYNNTTIYLGFRLYFYTLMRHLPNLLTLANLFCGCLAIVCVLNAQPFLTYQTESGLPVVKWDWVYGVQQLQWGGILIFLAAIFDLLDGFAARGLGVSSPIGKDLDSLADVVSFGVAPSVIIYKLLWDAVVREPNVTDVDIISLAPAFAIALFAALRLARFNVAPPQQGFTGMPTPAVGLLVASFALMDWDHPNIISQYFVNRWVLYGIVALLCYLMVSKVRFMKMMPYQWKLSHSWPQLLLAVLSLVLVFLFRTAAIPMAFVLYILLSFVAPKPATATLQ